MARERNAFYRRKLYRRPHRQCDNGRSWQFELLQRRSHLLRRRSKRKPAEKKFTQAELDDIISKRLAKERAKFEEQLKNKVSEAERLAKLSEDERQKEEIRIAQEELNNTKAEFEKIKGEFERQQLLAQITKELDSKGLPISMADKMIGADAETTKANIEKFEVDWKASLEQAIKNEIKNNSSSPRIDLKDNEGQTKDPKDMTLSEFIEYQAKQNK